MPVNITILDSYTLNPGDLSWDAFKQLGQTSIYENTPPELRAKHCKDAQIIITNKTPIDAKFMAELTDTKYIGISATGFNIVDVKAARKQGIVVTNIPDYGTDSVAQHTFALLLELTNQVGFHAQSVGQGDWVNSLYWSYWNRPILELANKKMGIVGMGRIGLKVAEIAQAFGMQVLAYSRTPKAIDGIKWMSLEDLFEESDVVSLHLPLTTQNEGFINSNLILKMKSNAFLINTARGPLLNEQDVADALNNGQIAGAALDVLRCEPPTAQNPLLTAKNCIITPHNAWASLEARSRLMAILVDNVRAFLAGNPQNVVS